MRRNSASVYTCHDVVPMHHGDSLVCVLVLSYAAAQILVLHMC